MTLKSLLNHKCYEAGSGKWLLPFEWITTLTDPYSYESNTRTFRFPGFKCWIPDKVTTSVDCFLFFRVRKAAFRSNQSRHLCVGILTSRGWLQTSRSCGPPCCFGWVKTGKKMVSANSSVDEERPFHLSTPTPTGFFCQMVNSRSLLSRKKKEQKDSVFRGFSFRFIGCFKRTEKILFKFNQWKKFCDTARDDGKVWTDEKLWTKSS